MASEKTKVEVHKKKAKRHKEENNQCSTFRPFKIEKKGKDEKMLIRRARRRKRIVNRSPRLQDMSKRVGWGEMGSKRQKEKEKGKNEGERLRSAL